MKNILISAVIALTSLSFITSVQAEEKKETVKVCVDIKDKEGKPVKDAKTGKVKQSCKEMKVHKKLEGTKVPEKK
jgi:hypothetical protein